MIDTFGFDIDGNIDVVGMAARKGFLETGLKSLAAQLNMPMEKCRATARSAWSAERLTDPQTVHAAEDAWFTFMIAKKLKHLPDANFTQVEAGDLGMRESWKAAHLTRCPKGVRCDLCRKGPWPDRASIDGHIQGKTHINNLQSIL